MVDRVVGMVVVVGIVEEQQRVAGIRLEEEERVVVLVVVVVVVEKEEERELGVVVVEAASAHHSHRPQNPHQRRLGHKWPPQGAGVVENHPPHRPPVYWVLLQYSQHQSQGMKWSMLIKLVISRSS